MDGDTHRYTGKAFGALKTAIIRVIKRGYAPKVTQVMVAEEDRKRLRSYCQKRGLPSMIDGFSQLLDAAGVPGGTPVIREGGRLENIITDIKLRSKGKTPAEIANAVRRGEFDQFIRDYYI